MTSTMKKATAFMAAAALAATLGLAGCGGSQAASTAASAASETASAASAAASETASAASAAASEAASAASAAASEAASAASTAASAASTTTATSSYIGDQAAIDIALADAGFAASDVFGLDAELDLDDAVVHYDVEFKQGNMEYDYDIDATTGAILYSHSEIDD